MGCCQSSLQFFNNSQLHTSYPSDVYLSNPSNLEKTQIRKTANITQTNSTGSYLTNSNALILGCKPQQNRQLLNKYLLAYLFFINKQKDKQIQIQDFGKLLNILDEDQKFSNQIMSFKTQYEKNKSLEKKADFLIAQYFKNGFFSSAIQKFPLYSSDPSILGYARGPIIDLNKAIKSKYENQTKRKQIFCVIQVSFQQQKLLSQLLQHQDYFTFSSFVRCFSNEKTARQRQKQLFQIGNSIRESDMIASSTIFLNIHIPKQNVQKKYDYGFYQNPAQQKNPQGDIIMNILNFFQVVGAELNSKTYDLRYNGLARLQFQKNQRQLKGELPQILQVINLIEDQCQQIKTHSQLIRIVNNRELSIKASQTLKQAGLPFSGEDNQRINLIEAYIQEQQYQKALQQCKKRNQLLQFRVRELQVLYEQEQYEEVQKLLKELKPHADEIKSDHFKEFVILQFVSAKINSKKGQMREAKRKLKDLINSMRQNKEGCPEFRIHEVVKQLQKNEKTDQAIFVRASDSFGTNFEEYGDGLNISALLKH